MSITNEDAYNMGAKGGEPTEAERLLFESWMRGHCWFVVDTWDGRTYDDRPEYREQKTLDPTAMQNRQLWAAWRDRAALSSNQSHQRQPLTDERIKEIHAELCGTVGSSYDTMASAIEAEMKVDRDALLAALTNIERLFSEKCSASCMTQADLQAIEESRSAIARATT